MPDVGSIIKGNYVFSLEICSFSIGTLAKHKQSFKSHIYKKKTYLSVKTIPELGKIARVSPLHSHLVPEKQVSFRIKNSTITSMHLCSLLCVGEGERVTIVLRHAKICGVSPWLRSARTLCWVGFVFWKSQRLFSMLDESKSSPTPISQALS